MISPLPGGIDDTAPKRDPFEGKSDGDLMADAARIQEELLAIARALQYDREASGRQTRLAEAIVS